VIFSSQRSAVTRAIARGVAFALLLTVSTGLAALRICAKCGYENPDGGTSCSHCGAVLPQQVPEVVTGVDSNPVVRTGSARVDEALVEEEVRRGQERLARNEPDLAKLFFRNALAFDLLTGKTNAVRSGQIGELLQRCDALRGRVKIRCPACDGTGRRRVNMIGLDGREIEVVGSTGSTCPRCGGSGSIARSGTVSDRKLAIGKAMGQYRTLQQGRRFVPVGGAWLPEQVASGLTVRDRVTVLRATAAPCAACLGTCQVDCTACSGSGNVKCTNRSCVGGRVTLKPEERLGRSIEQVQKCKICGGTGVVPCERCRGSGALLCKACNGTGDRALCQRCGGAGLTPCQRCSGTGQSQGVPCKACAGKGEVLCTGCQGDGRKR
jgi:hypothetical protein